MTQLVNFLAITESAPAECEPLSFQGIKSKKRSYIKCRMCWSLDSKKNQKHIDEVLAGSSFVVDLQFIWLKCKNLI